MRSLILIATCFVLANASFMSRNRFQRLLNRYQNHDNDWNDNMFGSDDVDDYIQDYIDEIRRERMLEHDQCPRDMDSILDLQDEPYDSFDFDEHETRGQDYETRHQNWYGENDQEMGSFMGGSNYLIREVEDANTKLATRLYKQCKDEKDDKNTVVSPLSIQLALAALNYGARGNTKRQIGRVIGGRLQKHERRQVFRTLVRHLKGFGQQREYSTLRQYTKINPVTGIFISQRTQAQQQFVQMVKGNLGTTVKHCSFQRQPEQCRQMINRWVSQKTQQKFKRIIPQDAITDNTKMILVNALEMKAMWGQQMRKHQTKQAKFFPLETNKVKTVEVMETRGRFKYYEDELVKIVGIPTQQHELTLYVIVPKEKDGLTEVEKLRLQDGVQLKQLLDVCDRRVHHVGVQLPKFQIKHKVDVRRTLRKQGVTDAFDPQRADFSGITGVNRYDMDDMDEMHGQQWLRYRRNPFMNTFRQTPFWGNEMEDGMNMRSNMDHMTGTTEHKLHLNKFIHQSTIRITEEGITATTGSGLEEFEQHEPRMGRHHFGQYGGDMEMTEYDNMDETTGFFGHESTTQKMVKANHAFAFVLKHNPTNQVVLVGRVIDAAQKKVNYVPQTLNTVDQF